MKKNIIGLLLLVLTNFTNGYVMPNILIKYNINNCMMTHKKILFNGINILRASIQNEIQKNKWKPVIGYIPDRLKKNNISEIKKWEPPEGYVPNRFIKEKNLEKEIIEKINKIEKDVKILKNNINKIYNI